MAQDIKQTDVGIFVVDQNGVAQRSTTLDTLLDKQRVDLTEKSIEDRNKFIEEHMPWVEA